MKRFTGRFVTTGGVVDSNNSPDNVDYIIPGNDDSIRAVKLYCQSASAAVLEAKSAGLVAPEKAADFVEEAAKTEG